MHLLYIDPGSGALLWQALIAGSVGVVYHFRRAIQAILTRVGRSKPASILDPEKRDGQ